MVAEEVPAAVVASADSAVVVSEAAGQAEVGRNKMYDERCMMYDLSDQTFSDK